MPSTALERPLSDGTPQESTSRTHLPSAEGIGGQPLVPASVARPSEEYEDQGTVSLPTKNSSLPTVYLFAKKESASPLRLTDSSK